MEMFRPDSKSKSRTDSQLALAYRIFIQLIAQKKPAMYTEFLTGILDEQDQNRIKANIRYTNTLLWLYSQMCIQDENSVAALTEFAKCVGESLLSLEKKKRITERDAMTYCYNIILYKDFFDKYVKDTKVRELWAQTVLLSVFPFDRIQRLDLASDDAKKLVSRANTAIVQLIDETEKLQTFQSFMSECLRLSAVQEIPQIVRQFM